MPSETKNIDSFSDFKQKLSNGNLITAHADYPKSISRMMVLFQKSVCFVFNGNTYFWSFVAFIFAGFLSLP